MVRTQKLFSMIQNADAHRKVCGGLYTLRGTRRPYLMDPELKPCSLDFKVLGGSSRGLESSWRALGHLLGTSWRVLGSWRPLGAVLESHWTDFGGLPSHLGGVLDGLEAILEALGELLGSKSEPKGHLTGSKKVPN